MIRNVLQILLPMPAASGTLTKAESDLIGGSRDQISLGDKITMP